MIRSNRLLNCRCNGSGSLKIKGGGGTGTKNGVTAYGQFLPYFPSILFIVLFCFSSFLENRGTSPSESFRGTRSSPCAYWPFVYMVRLYTPGRHSHVRMIRVCPLVKTPFCPGSLAAHQTPSFTLL